MPVYDQTGSGFYDDIVQVDASLDLDDFKLKVYPTFKYYMQYVDNTFGKNGSDRMWMAPLQEVYEYLAVKQTTVLSSELNGNQLEINLLLHNVPDELRRYALTLNIDANIDFNSVQVIGTSNYCFDGTGNDKLINLEWTANHSNTSFKTGTRNELSSSVSEDETFKMDIAPNPAVDFITVKFTNPTECNVNIALIDMLGKNILTRTEKMREGNTQLAFNLSKINSGFYLIKA